MFSFWKLMFRWGRKRAEKREAAKAALLDADDVRSVGPLLEALWLGDKMLRSQAEQALIRLLPQVRYSDAHDINPAQRQCLNHALSDKNPYLVLAAIKATEQVGDFSALPTLQKMSGKPASSAMDWRIYEAARECLRVVEERQRMSMPSTLLLASQAPGVPSSARRQPDANKRKG